VGFTVQHQGGMKDSDYQAYLQLVSRYLLKQGAYLDSVPRVPAGDNGHGWLYVWDDEAEATAFAQQLKKETRDRAWCVQPVKGKPSVGPIRGLQIEISRWSEQWIFAFEPFSEIILKMRFPDRRPFSGVTLCFNTGEEPVWPPENLRHLTEQILPLLTGLSLKQLSSLGQFRVVEAPEETELLPLTPLGELNAE
jgi:hypothetical protein